MNWLHTLHREKLEMAANILFRHLALTILDPVVVHRRTGCLILMDIDTWRVVEAQDRRVLREQHLVTCQDSQTVGSRELD